MKPIRLSLDLITTGKIHLIQESISEPTTYAKIMEGFIDIGFCNALQVLASDGLLSPEDLSLFQQYLPDHLRASIDS
jgi:hypothetical protein